MSSAVGHCQSCWYRTIALPQWHIAQRESSRVASSNASAASSYWDECIRATPRSKSDRAGAVAEIGNVTVPTWPAASAARDGAATARRTKKRTQNDDSLTTGDCERMVSKRPFIEASGSE